MSLEAASAATATTTALALALSSFDRWATRRGRHHLSWSLAFSLFAAASATLWIGAVFGWNTSVFRLFYLLGAVLTVPVTALGTLHLWISATWARRCELVVWSFTCFACGVLLSAPAQPIADPDVLPRGSEVFGTLPRLLAAVASGGGTLVIVSGSMVTIVRAIRRKVPDPSRVLPGNVLVLAGVVTLSGSGMLNSLFGEMTAFAITLAAGAILLFAGFHVATAGKRNETVVSEEPGEAPSLRAPGEARRRT